MNQAVKAVNPLLEKIKMPGETFRVPSGCLFYTNGEIEDDVTNGELRVFPMTAIDEIEMKSPDMLFSGDAVEHVFRRCIPQILQPKQLLTKDVDFLLVCLRKVTFGDSLAITYTHDCKDAKNHEYKMDMSKFIKNTKDIKQQEIAQKFTFTFPNDQVVNFKPVSFQAFVDMMQATQDETDAEALKTAMLNTLADIIVDVDEITDKMMIYAWLDKLSSGWLKEFNEQIEKTSGWGPSFDSKQKCKDCGKIITITAPLNPLSFFT